MRLRRIVPVLAFVSLLQMPSAHASTPEMVERPETDLLLLQVRMGGRTLAESTPAYEAGGGVVVPLGDLARLLGLAIATDPLRRVAEGFIITEQRTFRLDMATSRVAMAGVEEAYAPARVEAHADDIYVDTRLLARWLPIDLEVDLGNAMLTVRPREPLPAQLRAAREDAAGNLLSGAEVLARYPQARVPYSFLTLPFMDLGLIGSVNGPAGTTAGQYSVHATGDIGFMESDLFVTGSNLDALAETRFTLSRTDPDGRLLGPLRARRIALGTVFAPGIDLIALPATGRGILLNSFPIDRPLQFDRHTLRGNLPPGWQVELYRNETLIALQQSRPDGLYQFDDVPVLYGLNAFRLLFYGPQGQRRTERQTINAGYTLAPKGTPYYRLLATEDAEGRRVGLAELDFGLSRHLTVSAGGTAVDHEAGRRDYGRAGLRASLGRILVTTDGIYASDGGRAGQGTLQTRLGGLGLLLQHVELRDYDNDALRSPFGQIRNRSTVRLDATLPVGLRLPIVIEAIEDRLVAAGAVDRISARVSAAGHGLFLSNNLLWTTARGTAQPIADQAQGTLLISRFAPRYSVRGEAGYTLRPALDLASVTATIERRAAVNLGLGIGYAPSGEARASLFVSKSRGSFGFALSTDYGRGGDYSATASLSVGLSHDPRGGWHSQARPVAGSGAASARVFLDLDQDGVRDPNEQLLEGVSVALNRSGGVARTSARSTALLPNLPIYQAIEIGIVPSTIEDPLWIPAREGASVVLRPGKVLVIDFPVIASGEITGTVFEARQGGGTREAAGIELELVDRSDRVVKHVRTAYDGFYDLTAIPPGRYLLRVKPGQARADDLTMPRPRAVEVGPLGTLLDGIDLVLQSVSPSPATAIPPPALVAQPVAVRSERTAPRSATAAAPGRPSRPVFVVQVGSYRERAVAEAQSARLAIELASKSRVVAVDLGEKGRWYRVLIGAFASEAIALDFRRTLELRMAIGPVFRIEMQP